MWCQSTNRAFPGQLNNHKVLRSYACKKAHIMSPPPPCLTLLQAWCCALWLSIFMLYAQRTDVTRSCIAHTNVTFQMFSYCLSFFFLISVQYLICASQFSLSYLPHFSFSHIYQSKLFIGPDIDPLSDDWCSIFLRSSSDSQCLSILSCFVSPVSQICIKPPHTMSLCFAPPQQKAMAVSNVCVCMLDLIYDK